MNTQNAKTTQAGKALMRFTLLCVVFLLGLALIISCSLGGEEETSPSSSSAIRSSSSSGIPSSSSSIDCSTISSSSISEDLCLDFDPDEEVEHHGKMKKQFCDERDGKKYVYVQIGEQTWMAENLNYDVCGSKCGEGSRLVDANTENCDKYGRLYDWSTALTVCPDGWHLPSDEEWNVLVKYVDPNWISHTNNVAGTKLKATSGWVLDSRVYNCRENAAAKMMMESYILCGINGTDDYDFSALPSGYGSNNRFYGIATGYWWSATESPGNGGRFAYYQGVYYDTGYAYGHGYIKASFLSVRCVRD